MAQKLRSKPKKECKFFGLRVTEEYSFTHHQWEETKEVLFLKSMEI